MTPDAAPRPDDPRSMAAAAMQREDRRIRRLVGLTIGLWVLAGLVIPGFYLPLRAAVLPKFQQMEKHAQEKDPRIDAPFVAWHVATAVQAAAIATLGFLVVFTTVSLLAAVCTVQLVLTVRRVTLRQVREGLAEISQHLQRLERPTA
jgi:hypothetical protein